MGVVERVSADELVDIQVIEAKEDKRLFDVVTLFNEGVVQLRTLIEQDDIILHCPVSQGKDSTLVELMAIEAYRQSINDDCITSDKPLVLSTVDTGGEAIPMKMYVRYARKRILSYAHSHRINIHYDIVTPPINNEYFVKFAGGQKLVPNATRRGDCSIILKVEPSERYVKRLLEKLGVSAKVVTCIGSRDTGESSRRSANMRKQGISGKTLTQLRDEMDSGVVGKHTLYKFAPIRDWSTAQVFDALRIAGNRPLQKLSSGQCIPGFLPNFGLLLEIYGNGSNEVCEVSVGSNKSAGCNGKARFGCVYCTMVAAKDHSSMALSKLPRWRTLGAENALRVRDYLFRLSCDMDARALHARAYDPVTYNRVALQPNTLLPRYLEKMVRYASQLTLDSIRVSAEFRQLVKDSREMEHSGYADIASDVNIPPKTKKAFLEMYKECVQDPECLNSLFSEKHAILLSFRWSIDGIGAAPYRPLAIWKQLELGRGWIPYPKLTSEYEELHGPLTLRNNKELPDAVMFRVMKDEDPMEFATTPVSLLDLWSRPLDVSDLFDEDRNCSVVRTADSSVNLQVIYSQRFSVSVSAKPGLFPLISNTSNSVVYFNVRYQGASVSKLTIEGKSVGKDVKTILADENVMSDLEQRFYEVLDGLVANVEAVDGELSEEKVLSLLREQFPANQILKRNVPYLSIERMFTGYSKEMSSVAPALQFSQRVTKMNKGVISRTNSRLNFYKPIIDSRLHRSFGQEVSIIYPNFGSHTEKYIGTHDRELLSDNEAVENILVSERGLALWKDIGGLEKALEVHDAFIARLLRSRRWLGKVNVRQYGGTHVAEQLLSEGAITIAKTYWQQLRSILKRTHIFNELGLYTYQSMRWSEVVKDPRAIPMRQHRSDKAKLLLYVRERRNKQRRQIRYELSCSNNRILACNLDKLAEAAEKAVNNVIYKLNTHLLKLRFDTADVGPLQKANVSKLWLTLYFKNVEHVDDILKHVLSRAQLKELKNERSDYLAAGRAAIELINRIELSISDSLDDWKTLREKLCGLIDSGNMSLDKYRELMLSDTFPYFVETDMVEHWKPRSDYMSNYLFETLNLISKNTVMLEEIRDELASVRDRALVQMASKMSLTTKLAALRLAS